MATFEDGKGRTWNIAIDGSHVLAAKRTFGVNIPALFMEKDQPLLALTSDYEKFVGVLWLILEPQIEKAGLDEMEFVRGLAGEALGRAHEAFIQALIVFFPTAEQRSALQELWTLSKEVQKLSMEKMSEIMRQQINTINSFSTSPQLPE